MQDPPHPNEEAIVCPVCEQHTFWLMEGESARCPICNHFTTFGDPGDQED